MKKLKLFLMLSFLSIISISCTDNYRARNLGGTSKFIIPKNTIVLNATWKQNNLWVLVKDTLTNETVLIEESNYGIMNGKIKFIIEKQ